MAESQILGLFASPRSVEDAVRNQIRQTAPQFESAPNQRLFNAIAETGAAFDPRVQQARQQQEIAKNVTGTFGSAQYYYDLAEQFRQRGMLQSAVIAADKAKSIEDEMMDKATTKYGSISFTQFGSEATNIRRLIMQIERTSDPAAKEALQAELQDAFAKGRKEVAEREAAEAYAEEEATLKARATEEDRKKVQALFDEANAYAQSVIRIQENIGQAVENKTILTGPTAKIESNLYALGQRFGLTSSETQEMVANTQLAESIIGQAMLKQIKTLGTNPSNADREFLMKTLPDALNSPEGIKKIINFMKLRAEAALQDAEDQKAYFEEKKTLFGYKSTAFDKLEQLFKEEGITGSTTPSDAGTDITIESNHKKAETTTESVVKAEDPTAEPATKQPAGAVPSLIPQFLSSKKVIEQGLGERDLFQLLVDKLNAGGMLTPAQEEAYLYLDDIYGDQ